MCVCKIIINEFELAGRGAEENENFGLIAPKKKNTMKSNYTIERMEYKAHRTVVIIIQINREQYYVRQ